MSLKNKIIIIIIIFSFIIRAYNIQNPFSTNGIDEGIHLLQAKMMAGGYNYYEDLNGDQAPLALITFSLLGGNVIFCRYLSYAMFLISFIFLFLSAKKFGRSVAILSILILSLDLSLFRESRLASLDLFSASLLSISSFFFLNYIENKKIFHLALSSIFLSLSIFSKIIPFLIPFFILFYIIFMKKNRIHGIIYLAFLFLPAVFLFLFFSPHQLIEGIFLRQSHRAFDFYSKLSIILFFSSCFIYLYAIRKWNLKNHKILYLVSIAILIFVPLLIQGRSSQHHFVYISYPLAILSSIAINQKWNKRRVITAIFVSINLLLAIFFVFTAPRDLSYNVAREIDEISNKNDIIISGNPLINVEAHRLAPPNLTNLARYHYPEVSLNDIIYWLEKNETKVIVLYYHLYEIKGLEEYLENSSKWHFYKKIEGRGQILFYGIEPKFSHDCYKIYVKY